MRSLWNDQAVLIDAEQVSLLSPTKAVEDRLMCAHGGEPAEAVVALLATCARLRPWWRNRVHVWLGYPWTHTLLLPWQPGLPGGDTHWRGYAQALLRERGITLQTRVRLGPARHGHARLAVAADALMLDALEGKLREQKWALAACRDLLSASLQRYHRPARTEGACLVLAEASAVTCLWPSAQGRPAEPRPATWPRGSSVHRVRPRFRSGPSRSECPPAGAPGARRSDRRGPWDC